MLPSRLAVMSLLIALLSPTAALADNKWIEVRSPNFRVISNAGEKEARRTAYELEQVRAILVYALSLPSGEGAPVTVVVTEDLKLLQTLIPQGEKPPEGWKVFAMDSSAPENYYIALKPVRSSGVRTSSIDAPATLPQGSLIFVLYANRFVRLSYGMLPWWLEAGLSSFYGSMAMLKDSIRLGILDPNLQNFLIRQRLMPVEKLVAAERESITTADPRALSVFRAQSAAFVHYLSFGDDLGVRRPLREILTKVREGVDSTVAIESVVGDLKKLQRKFEAYIRRNEFLQLPMPAPSPVDLNALPSRPVSATEVDVLLADFHLQEGRLGQARPILEEATQKDAASPLVQMALGWLLFQQGKVNDGRIHLEKALASDDKNYLARYYLARTYAEEQPRAPQSARSAESGFRQVIQLNSRFAPAYDALANLLTDQSQLAEAARLSRRALELDRSVAAYYLTLSRISRQMNNPDIARQAAQQALLGSNSSKERDSARALLSGASVAGPPESTQAAAADPRPQLKRRESVDLPSYAEGTVRSVTCNGFEMQIVLATGDSELTLHSANFVAVEFLQQDKGPIERYEPCKRLKGTRAKVGFRLSGNNSLREIVAVELRN